MSSQTKFDEIIGGRRLARLRAQLLDLRVIRSCAVEALGEHESLGGIETTLADSFEDLETVPKQRLLETDVACPEGEVGSALGERSGAHEETCIDIHLARATPELAGTLGVAFHRAQASDLEGQPCFRKEAVLACAKRPDALECLVDRHRPVVVARAQPGSNPPSQPCAPLAGALEMRERELASIGRLLHAQAVP